jgi:hypothetical protein
VVITIDPILTVPKRSNTLFAYYMHEHTDRLYTPSKQLPVNGYDLFLAHILDSNETLMALPEAMAFPYLRDPDTMRTIFRVEPKEIAWVDWRMLTYLGMSQTWNRSTDQVIERLEHVIGLPIHSKNFVMNHKPYGVADPPAFGDAAYYLRAMAACKYYIALGRSSGAGQALGDAVSLGCICIGEQDKPYHRLLCHPFCLCEDLVELPQKLQAVRASTDFQAEILVRQDLALREHFVDRPLVILEQALEMKRKSHTCLQHQAISLSPEFIHRR